MMLSKNKFCQEVPPLLDFLQSKLNTYHEFQVLQEQVQNADDAGAEEVIFLYDKSQHPTESLLSDSMRDFNGPSLFVYNDATFQDQDWINIQNPQRSGKKKELTKIGRFGLGFLSVYHITDLPSILSGDRIGFLDPHMKYIHHGEAGMRKPLCMEETLGQFPDQFTPYINPLFRCSESNFQEKTFAGTIFRFPLRRNIPSDLSDKTWNDQKIHKLFESFQLDAHILPLFLKSVRSISFYEKNSVNEDSKLLFTVTASRSLEPGGDSATLQSKRNELVEAAKLSHSLSLSWPMTTTVKVYGNQTVETSKQYLTVNTVKNEGIPDELNNLVSKLNVLPWVGVSMPLGTDADIVQTGRTFCFLPLPEIKKDMRTGLPIHVHGYFGLGEDRRSIEWPSQKPTEKPTDEVDVAKWNKCLVDDIFPHAYADLIDSAIQNGIPAEEVYRAWPKIAAVDDNWENGVYQFLQIIKDKKVICSSSVDQTWLKPSEVYIEPSQNALVQKVLKQKGYHVPDGKVPEHVLDAMRWAEIETKYQKTNTKPSKMVREAIRGDSLSSMTSEDKMKLLMFILEDEDLQDLHDIHLLPLADGSFTKFGIGNTALYIPTEQISRDIFPNMTHKFVADHLPTILRKNTCHQLKTLTLEMVPEVLEEALPRDWTRGKDTIVQWIPDGCPEGPQQPEHSWLECIWGWLRTQTPYMIDKFDRFPLVELEGPNGCHQLVRLKKNTMIYSSVTSASGCISLTESVASYLESLGVVVIPCELPEFIKQHPYIDKIILPPDINGIAAALESNWSRLAIDNLANCSNGLKDEIRHLFSHSTLHEHVKKLLRQLPLFPSTDGGFITVAQCKQVLPHDWHGIPVKKLGSKYMIESNVHESLAIKLGAESVAKRKFTDDIVKDIKQDFYNTTEILEIMSWILQDSDKSSDFDWNFRFVPTANGLQSPNKLFSPDDSRLNRLFKGKPVFPVGEFAQGNLLNCLKEVGMREVSSVDASEILEVAITLQESQDRDAATALLEHITEYSHLLHNKVTRRGIEKPLWKFLQDRSWVPCQTTKPTSYPESLEWKGETQTLYRPDGVALLDSANLLGSVKPLVNLTKIPEQFRHFFCWGELSAENFNNVKDVSQHLGNVIEAYPQSNLQAVSRIVEEIYAFLSKSPERHLKNIFINNKQPIIWHGSGFTIPDKVAITRGNISVNLVPYLFTLPETFHEFRHLFYILGVKEELNTEALSQVLVCIQQKHMQSEISDDDTKTDLRLVCDILNSIVAFTSPSGSCSDVLVPCREAGDQNKKLKMVLSSKCLYVDEERLIEEYNRGLCEEPVVHEMIPNALAKQLQLRPLSHFVAPVDSVDLGYEIEGPNQSTVNAIKRNLEMYKEGLDIFKEIIQNADDAGASEVRFLIDWRENTSSKSKLLSDGMEMCHGPALWAYNNAKFTEKDITNICSIAAASKKDQLDKIGRFGLGFTSVYHITDVPSLVSGSYVMILDPRTNHLGTRVNTGRPGIKLDIKKEKHRATLRSYPNQFQPFQGIFGCDMSPSTTGYDNTLFRLPLRTQREAADTSQDYLSGAIYDSKEKMDEMVKSLKDSASTLLLFTQNVTHVKVQALGKDSSPTDEYETLLDVSVSCINTLEQRCIENKGNSSIQRQILKKTLERMKNESLPVPESTCLLKVTETAQVTTTHKGRKDKTTETLYVVSSCMATDRALQLAKSEDGRKAGVLPCGGVAVQLETGILGHVPVPCKTGSAFSYLPLNVITGLPFHINGNFLLQPNRRHLWSQASSSSTVKDGGEFEARWNICLMEEVLSNAIINLLHDLQVLHNDDFIHAHEFQTVWPRLKEVKSDFHPLVQALYKQIGNGHKLIYNGKQWVGVRDCFFLHESLIQQDVQSSVIAVLNEKLRPKRWVHIEDSILKSMSDVCADQVIRENKFDLPRFLKEIFFPVMNDGVVLQSNHRNKVILHLLDIRLGADKQTQYDDDLRNCDCIPVSTDNENLVRPGDLVHPRKPVGQLFDQSEGRFPCGDGYQREERLLSLEELGMATDDLAWEDICEVAECVGEKDLSKEQKIQKTRVLLQLIDNKLVKSDTPSEDQVKKLKNATFLPVLNKPSDFPLAWCTIRSSFMSASQVFEAKHTPIIGSVQPLLDETCLQIGEALKERVFTFLGIRQRPVQVEDVIKQLRVAIGMTDELVPQEVTNICHRIYSFLNETLCTSVRELPNNTAELLEELKHLSFILIDRRFLKCEQVAFKHPRQSGKYLFTFPNELHGCKPLFEACGVRETFEIKDFVKVLSSLKETHQDMPLPSNDISAALDALSALTDEPGISDHRHEVWVPDSNAILQQVSQLTYNDIPWEQLQTEELSFPCTKITLAEAQKLGMNTRRQLQLESYSSREGFESPFGQSEELTDRLKGILQQYPHVPDVFKELLQNADDSGAKEIHFVYDPIERESEKLVDDTWAPIHKLPALCVYNDKAFSPADLKGIQEVGVGGKLQDTTTTGRFGIGFNATYHLTDCPTFVSNNTHLCLFDPQRKYIPGATIDKPGMLYNVDGEDGFRAKFPDMMSGYLGDKFKLEGATMFRFPLRSDLMADYSKISSTSFPQRRIDTLLDNFGCIARESLLFLNHIKKISISCIDKDTGNLLPKYVVEAFVDTEGEAKREDLAKHLILNKERHIADIPPMHKVYQMEVKDKRFNENLGKTETWLVSQTIGLHSTDVNLKVDKLERMKTYLPRGGAAALLGMQESSNKRSVPESQQSSHPQSDRRYKAFCFLPLPIYTGLPIHVNGSFVLDTSRKNLVRGEESFETSRGSSESIIHKWNRLLVMHVIAPAYAYLIEKAGRVLLDPQVDDFQSKYNIWQCQYDKLFPKNVKTDDNEWPLLGKATLQYIEEKCIKVLPVVTESGAGMSVEWHHPTSSTSGAFFDNLTVSISVISSYMYRDDATNVRNFLLSTGFKLVSSSRQVCDAFQNADVKAEFVSSQSVIQHLVKLAHTPHFPIPCSVTDTALRSAECCRAVLRYCLEGITDIQELKDVPLCLTNDGNIRLFSATNPPYMTAHVGVLPRLQECFIHKDLVYVFTNWLTIVTKEKDTNEKEEYKQQMFQSGLLRDFTIYELSSNICNGTRLPVTWQGQNQHVRWTPGEIGHPDEDWLENLWAFILSVEEDTGHKECMNVLRDWPIIPTCQRTLVPPSQANTVLFLDTYADSCRRKELVRVLRKSQCPEVDVQHMYQREMFVKFPDKLLELLQTHLVVPTNQAEVLRVLHFHQTKLAIANLSKDDAQILLVYFQEGCSKFTTDETQILKGLHIFPKAGGELCGIVTYKYCHVIPCLSNMPDCQRDLWMNAAGCIFLERREASRFLYETLGIRDMCVAEIYIKYILPNFNLLDTDSKMKYMEHIKNIVLNHIQPQEMEDQIIEILRKIPFIRTEHGDLHPAAYFFYPHNAVFKVMAESQIIQQRFLPEYYSNCSKWRKFLSKIGLKDKVTPRLFVDFAKEIEQSASVGLRTEAEVIQLEKWSKALCEEMKRSNDLQNEDVLAEISDIRFIPSAPIDKELLQIHPAPSDNTAFIAYRGSVAAYYTNLVWSVAKLLPIWAIPQSTCYVRNRFSKKQKNVQLQDCLGIGMKATLVKTLAHTHKICHNMAQRNRINEEDRVPTVRKKFKAIMNHVYQYLSDALKHNCGEIKSKLKDTPICLVDDGHVLVRSNQMVERLNQDKKSKLQPYVYEVQRELAPFYCLFQHLGATESISFDQLAGVLAALHELCIDHTMDPNQIRTAHAVVYLMFNLLEQTDGKCNISVNELYLPTPDNHLILSTCLSYADNDLIGNLKLTSSNEKFIIPLNQCGLRTRNESKLIELLPSNDERRLRPQDLHKSMSEKPCHSNEECEAEDDCEYLKNMKKIVTSEEMQRVLYRLLRHQSKGNPLTEEQVQNIAILRESIRFKCLRKLNTGLYDVHGNEIMMRNKSRRVFFLKVEEPDVYCLYLEHVDYTQIPPQVLQNIAKQIDSACGIELNDISVLAPVLACQELDDMNTLLTDEYDIPEYDDASYGGIQPDMTRPGIIVPMDIRHLLVDSIINLFHPGEIAAYSRPLDEEDCLDSQGTQCHSAAVAIPHNHTQEGELIYVEVLERLNTVEGNQQHGMQRRYKIDIGTDEPIIVSVTLLYKFRHPRLLTMIPFEGDPETEPPAAAVSDPLPMDLERARREIKESIQVALTLSPRERGEVVRRLYRQWHPDRNMEQQALATPAFQFLMAEIQRVRLTTSQRWDSEIRRERQEEQRYNEEYFRRGHEYDNDANFVPPSFSRETPDPRNGRLWFRQAKDDFQYVLRYIETNGTNFAWVAFMVHQIVEKALKAARYSQNGKPNLRSNDLRTLVSDVCGHSSIDQAEALENSVSRIIRMECDFNRTRYPESSSSRISRDMYAGFKIQDAVAETTQILEIVRNIIGIQVF